MRPGPAPPIRPTSSERDPVGGIDEWQEARQHTAHGQCGGEADPKADHHELQALSEDQPENVARLRAEGYADTDFPRPQRGAEHTTP
jgi:hypothetical protein